MRQNLPLYGNCRRVISVPLLQQTFGYFGSLIAETLGNAQLQTQSQ